MFNTLLLPDCPFEKLNVGIFPPFLASKSMVNVTIKNKTHCQTMTGKL